MAKVLKFAPKSSKPTNTTPDYSKLATIDFKLTQDELIMIKEIRSLPPLDRGRVMAYASGTCAYYSTMQ